MAVVPILISGAGPAGLILALSLAKQGIPVRIIDKVIGPKLGRKGTGITVTRSLEVYRLLGALPDILSLATGVPVMRQYDPADPTKISNIVSVPVKESTPQIPYMNSVILGQTYQERIFTSHLEKLGISVEFGSELRSFKQTDDFVTGEIVRRVNGQEFAQEFKTPWFIGTDGAHSIVRKTLGLSFLGETREDDNFVIADVKLKGQKETQRPEAGSEWGEPSTKMARLLGSGQDDGIAQLIMVGAQLDAAKVSANRESIIEGFYDITGRRDIAFEEVVWFSRYRPNIRMVDQVRVGRALIAGDAAHCHSPVGGQGLNSGIQDSFNLGWKLALVYKGFAPSTLLDTYAEERDAGKRGRELNQLGVNYRGSSIVYEDDVETLTIKGKGYNDDSEVAARPGDRAPDAPGLADTSDKNKVILLYDVFSVAAHTVLIFSDTLQGHSALFQVVKRLPGATVKWSSFPKGSEALASDGGADEQFDKVLVDNEGYAYAGYHIDQVSLAIIRPDGVVGARVLGVSGVERYFKRIFV
ncbi:FAD binding domain-containing protein [Gymnopilus junonius]|uniref:FAD binding domain-containing protein n=1 Tax=Gymnopilus junonius TaxID=109634 RepID=A0A9P5TP28_GYMJU|nr:FAD binding domain-containing protein [Gymnopilus junonius]